ncbi:MAG: phosphoglycerate dehydrogenase, partial [Deltaproteobacteria bacterium]|nr:phosphoglycerate dehydrogenase [Deltaproteobacteria bacterium]
VTLHLPLNAETKNLLNAQRISGMKKGAYLINCARGGIVDETAVASAVRSGQLKGAAFDVFAEEPLSKTSPLVGVPGIILTPHLGAQTHEGQRRAGLELANIVIGFTAP